MGDEGQPSAVAERGPFVVIGYLLWEPSRISAVWPAEIRAKACQIEANSCAKQEA